VALCCAIQEHTRGTRLRSDVAGGVPGSADLVCCARSFSVIYTASFAWYLVSATLDTKLQEPSNVVGAVVILLVRTGGLGRRVHAVHSFLDFLGGGTPPSLVTKSYVVVVTLVLARCAGPNTDLVETAASASRFVSLRLGKGTESCTLCFAKARCLLVGFRFHFAIGPAAANSLSVLVFRAPVGDIPAKFFARLVGNIREPVDSSVGRFGTNVLEAVSFLVDRAWEVAIGPEVRNGEVTGVSIVNSNVINTAGAAVDLLSFSVHGPGLAALEVAACLLAFLPALGWGFVNWLNTREELHGVNDSFRKTALFELSDLVLIVLVVKPFSECTLLCNVANIIDVLVVAHASAIFLALWNHVCLFISR